MVAHPDSLGITPGLHHFPADVSFRSDPNLLPPASAPLPKEAERNSVTPQGQHEPGKSCPLCREPIAGIFRYGRTLHKRAADRMQRTFMQSTGIWLARANARLANLDADMNALLRDGECWL